MQNIIKQAYQANVLLREAEIVSIGTRYPFKDQVVLTTENTYSVPDTDNLFTYTQRIDVCVRCENKLEAIKLSNALKKYFDQEKMLLLHAGIFQKPFTRDNQKSRKHYAFATISGADLLSSLPDFQKDKSLNYALGSSPIESGCIKNGFDLTYLISDFTLEHLFLTEINGVKLDKPFYKLKLCTTSIIENTDDKTSEVSQIDEIVLFEINGDSETEIISLAKLIMQQKEVKKDIFSCKGSFPKLERDFYTVRLSKTAEQLINSFNSPKKA